MARSKRTPETVKTITETIRVGGSDVDACIRAGISQETFYQWMKIADFSEQVNRARVDGKIARIARIKKHGEADWRADAWYLERRWPQEYAQQLIIKVTPEQATALKKHNMTASELWDKMMQELANAEKD